MSTEVPARGYLLDTHVAIFSIAQSSALSAAAKAAVAEGPNFLSLVSYWEVMVKSIKGTLDVGDPRVWWSEALDQLAATPLLLRPQHIAGVFDLPPIHKDPFDRLIISQAIIENLPVISSDKNFNYYEITSIW